MDVEQLFKRNQSELLDEVEAMRRRNNHLHVEVYRIAFRHEPDRMRELIEEITGNDAMITALMKQAADA